MQTRRLGNTDLNFTPVGLGTWAIGGDDWGMGWGPQDEADSIAAILEALEAGMVCFHCGKSGAKLRSCGQCHRAHYCNRECQRKDWKQMGHGR